MPPHEPYLSIVRENYESVIVDPNRLTNRVLRSYFDACFASTLEHFGLYAAWTCVNCMREERATQGWGRKPRRCPTCNRPSVYQVATFNAWASPVGSVFASAVYYLLREAFAIPIHETPGNTTTHDFEITSMVAIEAKGSPSYVANPDGSRYQLGRPGMERSDTEKKAFANATTFRRRNPDAYYAVLTNALPGRLLNYRNDTVSGIFNLTRLEEIEVFLRDVNERIDLEAFRRREFGVG